jgi:hypothetical protein
MPQWLREEEEYLRKLMKNCEALAQRYKDTYCQLHSFQSKIHIPVIILSSLAGVASFGTNTFPQDMLLPVTVSVGLINIMITILNAILNYLKINDLTNLCLKASNDILELREKIFLELSLSEDKRESDGDNFARSCFAEYESIIASVPSVFKKMRFIRDEEISLPPTPHVSVENKNFPIHIEIND